MIKIRRALLSVADKTGLVSLAKELATRKVELIASGGTATLLRAHRLVVKDVAEITGIASALAGRIKTLHPALFGGLLVDRDQPEQVAELAALGGRPIDLAVVNFYPFQQVLEADAGAHELVANIDIGGPAMVRAAAKNHRHVAVLSDPADYPTYRRLDLRRRL